MTDYPGRTERQTARRLIESLPTDHCRHLEFRGIDLAPAAEHVLYAALRFPGTRPALGAAANVVRVGTRSLVAVRETMGLRRPGRHGGIVLLVTQPVHVELFRPVADALARLGEAAPLLVAARTGVSDHDDLERLTRADLRAALPTARLLDVLRFGVGVSATMRRVPYEWRGIVPSSDAPRLFATLRTALPRLALDAVRLEGLIARAQPRVIACFSESGVLDRVATATGRARGVPVVDLPHAEAADPWGSANAGYDGVAVYGPRAASVVELAGFSPDQIEVIGPLRYDRLAPADRPTDPPVVVFASQPVIPGLAHLSSGVKQLALDSAVAVAVGAGATRLVVVPHPTEDRGALERIVASCAVPASLDVEVVPRGSLHDWLPGAVALVTASSQSVFEAVIVGTPAIAVHPDSQPPPVTFVEEGIALGVASVDQAAAVGRRLREPENRSAILRSAREALDRRLGPVDGRAAERAARWLHGFGR